MKNNLKNALNALVLLGFMVLAWATSIDTIEEPIDMKVKINADSTAFLLTNLTDLDFKNGDVNFRRIPDSASVNTLSEFHFFKDSVSVKAKSTVTISFNQFDAFGIIRTVDNSSNGFKLSRFSYSVFLSKQKRKDVIGFFEFKF